MAILIKNPEVERKARELAVLTGKSITGALDEALDAAIAGAKPKRRKLSLPEMIEATEALHRRAGAKGPFQPVTKAEWDEINEIPGLAEDEA